MPASRQSRRPRSAKGPAKKKRAGGSGRHATSCDVCCRRKEKCDQRLPCSRCVHRNVASSCSYRRVQELRHARSKGKRTVNGNRRSTPKSLSTSPAEERRADGGCLDLERDHGGKVPLSPSHASGSRSSSSSPRAGSTTSPQTSGHSRSAQKSSTSSNGYPVAGSPVWRRPTYDQKITAPSHPHPLSLPQDAPAASVSPIEPRVPLPYQLLGHRTRGSSSSDEEDVSASSNRTSSSSSSPSSSRWSDLDNHSDAGKNKLMLSPNEPDTNLEQGSSGRHTRRSISSSLDETLAPAYQPDSLDLHGPPYPYIVSTSTAAPAVYVPRQAFVGASTVDSVRPQPTPITFTWDPGAEQHPLNAEEWLRLFGPYPGITDGQELLYGWMGINHPAR